MIDPELKSLVESEIADFYAGLLQPGEPETIEESQREITQRVLMVIECWCANRVKNRGKQFVVKLPGFTDRHVCISSACDAADNYKRDVIEAIKAEGGEIAE